MSNVENGTQSELRLYLDSKDPFMTAGHQIMKTRSHEREAPAWAIDDQKIQAILLRSFPNLKTPESKDAERAGRWMRVIHLYFRMGMTRGQVAEELGLPYRRIESLVMAVKRAAAGKSANGSGLYRKRGRPRRNS